jgi:CRP-like cAMP-binding protein
MLEAHGGTHAGTRNLVLGALSSGEVSSLLPTLRHVSLQSGRVLYDAGALIDTVYFPHDALISRLAVMRGGETVSVQVIGWEAAVGTAVALEQPRAIIKTVVQLAGTAACVPAREFRSAALKSPNLSELVRRCDSFQTEQVLQAAACNAVHKVEQRLPRCLLECSDRVGDEFVLTQQALAQMLGVRRTTVTIMAHSLLSAGAIAYRRGQIRIINRAALEASACECYLTLRKRADSFRSQAWTHPVGAA